MRGPPSNVTKRPRRAAGTRRRLALHPHTFTHVTTGTFLHTVSTTSR